MNIKKKSLHAIPSSQREKKRYLLISFRSAQPINARDFETALQSTLSSLYGTSSGISIKLMDWDAEENRAIIRCSRIHLPKVKSGSLFLSRVGNISLTPRVDLVSGSLKKLRSLGK